MGDFVYVYDGFNDGITKKELKLLMHMISYLDEEYNCLKYNGEFLTQGKIAELFGENEKVVKSGINSLCKKGKLAVINCGFRQMIVVNPYIASKSNNMAKLVLEMFGSDKVDD